MNFQALQCIYRLVGVKLLNKALFRGVIFITPDFNLFFFLQMYVDIFAVSVVFFCANVLLKGSCACAFYSLTDERFGWLVGLSLYLIELNLIERLTDFFTIARVAIMLLLLRYYFYVFFMFYGVRFF